MGSENFNNHMQRTRLIILVTLMAVLLFAGALYLLLAQKPIAQPTNKPGYRDISSEELNTMLANKDFLLINVHIPYAGEIKGTDLFIPYNKIPQSIDQLPADKDAKIVVYCRSGSMSAAASEELVKQGYTNIINLKEGMISWEQSGYSLVKP
ncbi:MAG: rhodanese-like domain-containing protein [Thaumarchaeota archaeon]|nr:rhodanese-like domain-containing protein [Nitrososphaerota archaeon]